VRAIVATIGSERTTYRRIRSLLIKFPWKTAAPLRVARKEQLCRWTRVVLEFAALLPPLADTWARTCCGRV
jgi:hypothetical protein